MKILSRLLSRLRGKNKRCLTCKNYPNCNMCAYQNELNPMRAAGQLTWKQKALVKTILRRTRGDLEFIPVRTQCCTYHEADHLVVLGAATLVKRGEYPSKNIYRLNRDHSEIKRLLS